MLTHPMRPHGGARFDKVTLYGDYRFEPKYDGWRVLLNASTGEMWNRHGEKLTIASDFEKALAKLNDCPFEWLDCEGLQRRSDFGKGSLVILDAPSMRGKTYAQRRAMLEAQFEQLPVGAIPENHSLVLTPSLTDGDALWRKLEKSERKIYEGMVAKKVKSLYSVQTSSPSRKNLDWVKFRFKG